MTKNLTVGSPAKVIFIFAVPLLIGNIFQQLYGLADAFIVGRMISVEALAAVGATHAVSFLILGFCWGMTTGLAIPAAQAFGAEDYVALRKHVASGAIISAIVSAVLVAIAVPLTRPMLELMRTPEAIIDDAAIFLTITYLSIPAVVAFNYLSSIIRALGDSTTPLVFLAASCVLNIGLVAAFIGWFGTGVGGAAFATFCAQLLTVVACLWLIKRRMPLLHVTRSDWRVTRADLAFPARIGLPMGFQSSIIAIGSIVVQFVLNGMGTEAVGAYTAAQRVETLAMAPLASFGIATATYVAQNYGARKYLRIRQGVFQVSMMSISFALTIGIINFTLGHHITRLFVGAGHEDIVDMSHTYLMINGAFYVALGLLFVWRNALQGLGKTFVPTLAGVMELVGRISVAIAIGSTFGFIGICVASPAAWVFAVIPLGIAWRRQRNRLIHEEEALTMHTAVQPVLSLSDDEPSPSKDPADSSLAEATCNH